MAVLRLGRFRAGPAGTGEMLTSHAALGAWPAPPPGHGIVLVLAAR
jgi:hypothetical protein